jgi:hypothetical protein
VRSTVPVVFLNGTVDPADPSANVAAATAIVPNDQGVILSIYEFCDAGLARASAEAQKRVKERVRYSSDVRKPYWVSWNAVPFDILPIQ